VKKSCFILNLTLACLCSSQSLSVFAQSVKPFEIVKPADHSKAPESSKAPDASPFPAHPDKIIPGAPALNRPSFPAYDRDSYMKMRMKQTRASTLWTAPNSNEQSMLQSVSESQLQQGVEDPKTLALSWKTAEYFCKVQKYNQAEPLLKELIATIESHPQTPQATAILSDAKKKLAEINEARTKRQLPGPGYAFGPMFPRPGMGAFSPSRNSRAPQDIAPRGRIIPSTHEWAIPAEIRSKSGFDYSKLNKKPESL